MHRILADLGREHPIGTYATDVIFADFDGCPDWVPPAFRCAHKYTSPGQAAPEVLVLAKTGKYNATTAVSTAQVLPVFRRSCRVCEWCGECRVAASESLEPPAEVRTGK